MDLGPGCSPISNHSRDPTNTLVPSPENVNTHWEILGEGGSDSAPDLSGREAAKALVPKAPELAVLSGPCSPWEPCHEHGQRSPCLHLYSCWKWPRAQRAVSSLNPTEGCHVASRNFVLFYFGKQHSNIFTTFKRNGVTDGSWALAFMGKAPLSRKAVCFPPNPLQPSDS